MKIHPRVSILFDNLQKIEAIGPDENLSKAMSLMVIRNVSKLVVLKDLKNNKNPIGILSWKSIGTKSMYQHTSDTKVEDFMISSFGLVKENDNLLKVSNKLMFEDVVLVQNERHRIIHLITAYDFTKLFHEKLEPFMLLESVENHIRDLINTHLNLNEVNQYLALKLESVNKLNSNIQDLTFYDYGLIFRNPEFYEKMKMPVDPGILANSIQNVSEFRNKVMHFKIEDFNSEDLKNLKTLSTYFRLNHKLSLGKSIDN